MDGDETECKTQLEGRVLMLEDELEGKNKEIQHLNERLEFQDSYILKVREREIESQRDLQNKKNKQFGKDAITTMREELYRQHRIMEKLEMNLNEHQIDTIAHLTTHYSESELLRECNKGLTSQKRIIHQLKENAKVDQPKNCINSLLSTGLQNITLSTGFTFEVLCNSDIAGRGWTVILQKPLFNELHL